MALTVFLTIWLAHMAAVISPGPSFIVCARVAAAEGFRIAAGVALGFGIAVVLWAAAALAGATVLFSLVPALYTGLKVVGGLVLVYIAIQMWRHAAEPLDLPAAGAAPRAFKDAVRYGFTTFAANPKPAVFFGAVFVGLLPHDLSVTWRLLILAMVAVNETGWYLLVARVFSLPRPRAAYLGLKTVMDRVFGTVLAVLGIEIALH